MDRMTLQQQIDRLIFVQEWPSWLVGRIEDRCLSLGLVEENRREFYRSVADAINISAIRGGDSAIDESVAKVLGFGSAGELDSFAISHAVLGSETLTELDTGMPENPFPYTSVVDDKGQPLTLYHGSREEVIAFDPQKTKDGGLHFGTLEQATMRSGGAGQCLMEVILDVRKPVRSKDTGGNWKTKIATAKARGYDGIQYLNRYEGIEIEVILNAQKEGIDLDRISDAVFRQMAPQARDSWIVFSASQVKITKVLQKSDLIPRKKTKP